MTIKTRKPLLILLDFWAKYKYKFKILQIWHRKHCCVHYYKSAAARRFLNIVFQVIKSLGIR